MAAIWVHDDRLAQVYDFPPRSGITVFCRAANRQQGSLIAGLVKNQFAHGRHIRRPVGTLVILPTVPQLRKESSEQNPPELAHRVQGV